MFPKIKKRKLRFSDFPVLDVFQEKKDRSLWKAKSHNQDKQIIEFISFTYFKYEAPKWAVEYIRSIMESVVSKEKRYNTNYENLKTNTATFFNINFKDFFLTIQEGTGHQQILQPLLTRKEIYYFMFKVESLNITEAILEARLLNAGVNQKIIEWVLKRPYTFADTNGIRQNPADFYKPALNFLFYLVKNDVRNNELDELLDYFVGTSTQRKRDGVELEQFLSRSINTIRQASNEWHINQAKEKNKKFLVWEGMYPQFTVHGAEDTFDFIELTTSTELLNEGRKMRHCVGSYASRCVNGSTRIVSVKKNGVSHITLELNRNAIIQAKLKLNAYPSKSDEYLIQKFAVEHNLKVAC